MSDTSKKRSRKSKLVPRDYGEDEEFKKIRMEELTKTLLSELETEDRQLDSLPNPLQTILPKLRTQLDKNYDYEDAGPSVRDIKFSVNVEVEKFDDNNENCDSDIEIVKSCEESKSTKCGKSKSQESVWPIYISENEYRSTVEKLSKVTRSLADKVLEVHIRNYLGRFVNEAPYELDYFKKCIQHVLNYVYQWQKSSKLRDAILSYKCYVCDIGWWHLGPFQEHIREHGERIRISFQTTPQEGCVVAHLDNLTGIKEIPIEGRCWQCMKTWDEHVNLKRNSKLNYKCVSCIFKSSNCSGLLEHEGVCLRYHKEQIKEAVNYETKGLCQICGIYCITESRLKAHLSLTHFARSDFPSNPPVLKKCVHCDLGYFFATYHTCRNKSLNYFCNYCMKRFAGKWLADIHMAHTKKNVRCSVCNLFLRSQCMEAEHMAKHSKSYVLLYKCVTCPNYNFFNDEKLMMLHRTYHPTKRYTKNNFFEMVVAPRKLFPCLPYLEDESIGPGKPHILGPKLAKKVPTCSATERTIAETQSAVDAIRYDHLDVHGHDYLLHPYNSMIEPDVVSAPKDDIQQQVADDTLAAIQSISDVEIKTEVTETEDYECYDQTEMNIVYEDIVIKKEEFLDTLSNAFVSAEDVTDCIDDEDISNVFKVSKQTVIKEEKKINELFNDSGFKTEEVASKKGEIQVKIEGLSEDDFDDDIILLNNVNTTDKNDIVELDGNNHDNTTDKNDIVEHYVNNHDNTTDKNHIVEVEHIIDDDATEINEIVEVEHIRDDAIEINEIVEVNGNNDDNSDDDNDDLTIINKSSETIEISDTEIQENDDSKKASTENNETSSETSSENEINKAGDGVKKERAKNKNYTCGKCGFIGKHRQYRKHRIKCITKSSKDTPTKSINRSTKDSPDPWPSYPCSRCNCIYPTFRKYIQHLDLHNIPPKSCPQCLDRFKLNSQLIYHIKRHITHMFTKIFILLDKDSFISSKQDNVYQCDQCVQVIKYKKFFKHWEGHLKFKTKRDLNVECKIERNEDIGDGGLAEMELSSDRLQMLLKILQNPLTKSDPTYSCVFCMRPFDRAPYLKRHYVEHLLRDALCKRVRYETETIACQICGEQFNKNLIYKTHMRNHASLTVYRCELCARSFSDSSNFAKHKKTHNIAAAHCDLCGAKFFRKESLIKHMKIHQLAEPRQCEHCPKVFHATTHYKRHVRNAHKNSSFTCNVCLMKFPRTRDRLDHMWAVHQIRNKKVDCPICNRSFRKFIDMKYHLKIKHNAGLTVNSKHFSSASEADKTWYHLNAVDMEYHKRRAKELKAKKLEQKNQNRIKKKVENSAKKHPSSSEQDAVKEKQGTSSTHLISCTDVPAQ